MLNRSLPSPKRSGARRVADLYYYYAGYSQSFVEQKLLELDLPGGSLVLDPWCGSGTTLAAARALGHTAFCCDINPVSVVLTKSRLATREDIGNVIRILTKTITSISHAKPAAQKPDALLWTLREMLFDYCEDYRWSGKNYGTVRPRTALLLTTLFFFARRAMREARSKNPSWRRDGTPPRLSFDQLSQSYEHLKAALTDLQRIMPNTVSNGRRAQVALVNNENEEISTKLIADAVFTSPPYLTRLDYGISTGLEWRLLKGDPTADLSEWRATFTGSVLTARVSQSLYPLPHSVSDLLRAIHKHQSKAAQTYYFQFFRNYFVGIQNSLVNISKICKMGAKALFVIQDSQFKDLTVPLTKLFSDILVERGWIIDRVEPFPISPTFYKINPKRWTTADHVRDENVIWAKRVR